MNEILMRLGKQFSPARLVNYLVDDLLPSVIVAAATLLGFYLAWLVLR